MAARRVSGGGRGRRRRSLTGARRQSLTGGSVSGSDVLAFLNFAGRTVSASLDATEILDQAVRLAVPALGDVCVAYRQRRDGGVERVAIAHRESEKAEAVRSIFHGAGPNDVAAAGLLQVLQTREPLLLGTITPAMLRRFARDDAHYALLRSIGIQSSLMVPLVARGHSLGVLGLSFIESVLRYRKQDVPLVMDFADRIAIALDNADLYRTLQSERGRLESVLEHLPAGVMLAEAPDGRIVRSNRMMQTVLRGEGPDVDLSHGLHELRAFHADGRPYKPDEWPLTRALSSGEVVQGEEIAFHRSDRSPAIASVSAAPLRDGAGHITGAMVVANDVTERIAARHKVEALATQLANQQRWLESLLNLSPVPLVLVEPRTGEVTFANRAADELAGGKFPREPVDARPSEFRQASRPDGTRLQLADFPVARAVRGERLNLDPIEWHLPVGTRSVLVSSERLPAMYGHPETLVISYLDVTRLRVVEAELQRAVRGRDEFLSIAAHELRTPITSLQLYLQGLVRTARSRVDPSGSLDVLTEVMLRARKAERQTQRLSRLVESLLDLSRINAGRLELQLSEVDLVSLVRDTVADQEDEARRNGCEVHFEAPPDLVGQWDPLRLEQVISNLLSNAFKYGAKSPVHLRVEDRGALASIAIRDQGIGISPDDQTRLFQRFERAVSERHYGGFGLGLWIVKQIVSALGGHVTVQSEPGRGSTFEVLLPKVASPPPMPGSGEAQR